MEEALQIIKGLFADGPLSFSGTYYKVNALEGYPKPVQRPYPPILIGGGGKRLLSIAAREATIVGFIPVARSDGSGPDLTDSTMEALAQKEDFIRALPAIGKRHGLSQEVIERAFSASNDIANSIAAAGAARPSNSTGN